MSPLPVLWLNVPYCFLLFMLALPLDVSEECPACPGTLSVLTDPDVITQAQTNPASHFVAPFSVS